MSTTTATPAKTIPQLGETARQVLAKAISYDRAGYLLKFRVVGEGDWQFNDSTCKFEKVRYPIVERVEGDAFDAWLEGQIAKGFVGIYIESPGKRPHYSLELHRARGIAIPLCEPEQAEPPRGWQTV